MISTNMILSTTISEVFDLLLAMESFKSTSSLSFSLNFYYCVRIFSTIKSSNEQGHGRHMRTYLSLRANTWFLLWKSRRASISSTKQDTNVFEDELLNLKNASM